MAGAGVPIKMGHLSLIQSQCFKNKNLPLIGRFPALHYSMVALPRRRWAAVTRACMRLVSASTTLRP
jgi:hypothetical protein